MLALKSVSHDTFAAAQMRKTCPHLKLLNPLTDKDAIPPINLLPLVECDTVKEVTG
jgi:hypothetical protein